MARSLRKLVVNEISSVDAAANEDARIVLVKRDSGTDNFRKIFGAHSEPTMGERLRDTLIAAKNAGKLPGFQKADDDDDVDDDDEEVASAPVRISSTRRRTANIMRPSDLIAALQQINPRSRALLASIKRDDNNVRKDQHMTRDQILVGIGKSYSAATIAREVIKQRDAGLSEREVVKMLTVAIKRRPGESSAQAFSRVYSSNDGWALRAATKAARDRTWLERLSKQGGEEEGEKDDEANAAVQGAIGSIYGGVEREMGTSTEGTSGTGRPDSWGGIMSTPSNYARDAGLAKRAGDAYAVLEARASELRKRDPSLSKAAAFTKIYTDPRYAALVKHERAQARARLGAR